MGYFGGKEVMEGIKRITKYFLDEYDLRGEDFDGTPERVSRMWDTFFNEDTSCNMVSFPTSKDAGIICIRDYHFWSFCPHHLLPVKYVAKIGYIPSRRAFGLSKLGRAAMCVAKKLPLQEDIARLIAEQLISIKPKGIAVVVNGEHLCMQMRGIKDPCVNAVSDYYSGIFKKAEYQQRFLAL